MVSLLIFIMKPFLKSDCEKLDVVVKSAIVKNASLLIVVITVGE